MVEVKSPIPGLWAPDYAVAIGDHNVRSRAASYRKLVREQILAILGMDNSRSSDQYYYCVHHSECMCLLKNMHLISMCTY